MAYPALKLISHKLCPYVQRARIVLAEKRIPYEIEFVDLSAKPDWFLKVSPLSKVPLLLVDGKPLFESSVIAEFLDEISPGSLHPADPFDKARNRGWMEYASATLNSIAAFYRAGSEEAFDAAVAKLRRNFETVEAELGEGPWFNGASFSVVDAAFAPVFRYFEVIDDIADFGLFDDLPDVSRWRVALRNRASVRHSAVVDYHRRLYGFLAGLESRLSKLIAAKDGQHVSSPVATCG